MSKYKARKTLLFTNIGRFAGCDVRRLPEEDLPDVRALIMCGYLVYDDSTTGMVLKLTPIGEEVMSRE